MQAIDIKVRSKSGNSIRFNGKFIECTRNIYEINLINNSHYSSNTDATMFVLAGQTITIPLTYISGADSSYVKVDNGTIVNNNIVLINVNSDVRITITDAPPTSNYFQFTNNGGAFSVKVHSYTKGTAFINDSWALDFPAQTDVVLNIPAHAVIKFKGMSAYPNQSVHPMLKDNGTVGDLSIDRFDESLTQIDFGLCLIKSLKHITSWEGASNYVSLRDAFNQAGLIDIPDSWEGLENVSNMHGAFHQTESLVAIPDSWKGLESVTNMYQCFTLDSALITGGNLDYSSLSNLYNVEGIFWECRKWQGKAYDLYNYLANKSITVTSHSYAFRNCLQSVGYSNIPSTWK